MNKTNDAVLQNQKFETIDSKKVLYKFFTNVRNFQLENGCNRNKTTALRTKNRPLSTSYREFWPNMVLIISVNLNRTGGFLETDDKIDFLARLRKII